MPVFLLHGSLYLMRWQTIYGLCQILITPPPPASLIMPLLYTKKEYFVYSIVWINCSPDIDCLFLYARFKTFTYNILENTSF